MATIVLTWDPDAKIRFAAGLDWNLLPARAKRAGISAEVRLKARAITARQYVTVTASRSEHTKDGDKELTVSRTAAGFVMLSDGSKLKAGHHSLAAAFAGWAHQHPEAVLCVRAGEKQWAVVVVAGGLPVVDKVVKSVEEAFALVSPYTEAESTSVFSDDARTFPRTQQESNLLRDISTWANKSTAIRTVPVDLALMAGLAAALVVGVGGFQYWQQWKAEKEREELLARQRAEDPVPKYLSALAAARQSVGLRRESVASGLEFARQIPLTPEGWEALRVGCTFEGGCEVVYRRTTGTYAGLVKAVSQLQLKPSEGVDLNEARMGWTQAREIASLDPAVALPPMTSFIQGPEASKLQDWLVAGLTLQLAPQQLWPRADGVPDGFRHPEALGIGRFDVDGIALPQVAETIKNAPSNVVWVAWSVELGDAKQEPLSRAKARLYGNYYVKYN